MLRVRAEEIDWNLTLTDWGRTEALAVPNFNPAAAQAANRVEYTDGNFTAWYVNGPLGLQQGWTVQKRPAGEGDLMLALRSQGLAVGSARGAACVFVSAIGNWANTTETAKLTASDGANFDNLGSNKVGRVRASGRNPPLGSLHSIGGLRCANLPFPPSRE